MAYGLLQVITQWFCLLFVCYYLLLFNNTLYMSLHTASGLLSAWSGGAKVSCILRHWGVQLILAYTWARPAILVAGKGWGMFLFCFFTFIPVPFFSVPLLHLFCYFFYLFSPFLWETTQNDSQGLVTLYQDCSSRHDLSKNMAARGRGLFSLYTYLYINL